MKAASARSWCPEGSEGVKVNAPIAVLLGEGEKAGDVDISGAMKSIGEAVKAEVPKKAEAPKAEPRPKPKRPKRKRRKRRPLQAMTATAIFASPLARRIAAGKGIDLASLSGSGPRGRIVKSDVENAKPGAAKPAAAGRAAAARRPAPASALRRCRMRGMFYKAGEYEEIPHDSMRKAIAKRLTSAKALIPHYYLTIDCNLTALMATRAALNAAAPKARKKSRPTNCRSMISW